MPRRRPKVPSGGGSSSGAFGLASGYGYGISRCGEDRTFGAEAGQGLNPAQAMRRVARSKPLEFGEFFEVFDAKGTAAKVSMAKPPVRLSHFARPGRFERRQIPHRGRPCRKALKTYREERVQKVRRGGPGHRVAKGVLPASRPGRLTRSAPAKGSCQRHWHRIGPWRRRPAPRPPRGSRAPRLFDGGPRRIGGGSVPRGPRFQASYSASNAIPRSPWSIASPTDRAAAGSISSSRHSPRITWCLQFRRPVGEGRRPQRRGGGRHYHPEREGGDALLPRDPVSPKPLDRPADLLPRRAEGPTPVNIERVGIVGADGRAALPSVGAILVEEERSSPHLRQPGSAVEDGVGPACPGPPRPPLGSSRTPPGPRSGREPPSTCYPRF